ncbi:anti-sigma factor family protein [Streptomyces sp. NPDC060000]|uniref:anti-sigma factor family protein n=1 Tax=Streptomyces sp. NPDC060000 TaxID=3347031 RepID=UPI0036BD0FDA
MTSTTDTTGHPDVTEISDLTEGLLDPSRSADVRRHLDTCELCADVHASLAEIRGLLGTLPSPSRMPDDVAHRIDAALAAEALLNATAPEDARVSQTTGVTSDADALHVSRETTTATDRPAGRARPTTTGPGRKDRKRSGRRRVAVLGAVLTAAALGLGSVLVSSLTGGGAPGSSAHRSTGPDTFSVSRLEGQVTDLLAKAEGSRSPHSLNMQGESDTASPGAASPKILLQPPTVPPCVQEGIGRSDAALATEDGTYQGTDALLVVLPDASDSTRIDAYLMDKTCVEQSASSPAKVLLQNSYTRR